MDCVDDACVPVNWLVANLLWWRRQLFQSRPCCCDKIQNSDYRFTLVSHRRMGPAVYDACAWAMPSFLPCIMRYRPIAIGLYRAGEKCCSW